MWGTSVGDGRYSVDFDGTENTEHNVHLRAKRRDPGLRRHRKLPDGSAWRRSYPGEWQLKDDNSRGIYAPLRATSYQPGL